MTKIKDKIIGLKELRENTESYISAISRGKSFVVMRKSQPVFTISPVDEWGDEGTWETVVDFTKIDKKGVKITDVINSLKQLSLKDK
jgi:antitoxin (DNA-binding transcriptional repressor) of toxin-antitoxin stability system